MPRSIGRGESLFKRRRSRGRTALTCWQRSGTAGGFPEFLLVLKKRDSHDHDSPIKFDVTLGDFSTHAVMMTKPRLLVVTEWFAPGYRAGGPIRSTTNLVAAMGRHFDISVVTSDRDLGMHAPYPGITPGAWTPYGDAARVQYVAPAHQTVGPMGKILQEVGADCVYLNSMFSARFTIPALVARWRLRLPGRMVLAPRGELLPGALRFKAAKKMAFLALLRASGVVPTLHFHATDDQEREAIVSRLAVSPAHVTTVANFPEPPGTALRPLAKSANAVRMLFLSRVAPKKNLVFLLERLRELPPDVEAHLTIAGPQEDAAYWKQCSRVIQDMGARVRVDAIGAVAHDQVRSLIEEHHVFVLPTFGENYGHSIVEALGSGRPVIVSDRTPWRDLATRGVGWDLCLEEPSAFTAAITAAARLDQASFDRMCHAALTFAQGISSNEELTRLYVEMFMPR